MYRTNKNGIAPDAAGKARWAKSLNSKINKQEAD
jgi:hypothetical protein